MDVCHYFSYRWNSSLAEHVVLFNRSYRRLIEVPSMKETIRDPDARNSHWKYLRRTRLNYESDFGERDV